MASNPASASKMPNASSVEKILPVAGSVVLFLAWAIQTLLYSHWSSLQGQVSSSEAVFHAYRAADGVFRGLRLLANDPSREEIDIQQLRNFQQGQSVLTQIVDSDDYRSALERDISTLPDGTLYSQLTVAAQIHIQYNAMQRVIGKKRSEISHRKDTAENIFLTLYVFGTGLVICGGFAKIIAGRKKVHRD